MKILILDNKNRLREIVLDRRKVTTYLALAFAIMTSMCWSFGDDLLAWYYQIRYHEVTEPDEVAAQLRSLKTRVDSLQRKTGEVSGGIRALRSYLDGWQVGKELTTLGIGGSREKGTLGFHYLPDSMRRQIQDLTYSIDTLGLRLNFQRWNLAEIDSFARYQENLKQVTPAIRPTRYRRISDDFGYRRDPFNGRRNYHYGYDFSAERGKPVVATAKGEVTFAGWKYGYGQMVRLNHGYGYETMYAHNSKLLVTSGEQVSRGDTLALIGNSGRSTGPHLHYEVLKDRQPVNPANYLPTTPD